MSLLIKITITLYMFLNTYFFLCANQDKTLVVRDEFAIILDSLNLNGSILIYDSKNNVYYSNDFDWAKKKFIPASTFKIPNSIIGLEIGVLTDSTIFEWDGKPRRLKNWEQNLNLRNAFQYSCVPCYQENARNIGVSKMKEYLQKLEYPGMVFNDKTIDNFWLEGNSGISSFEQIDFLQKFYFEKLSISTKTRNTIMELMILDKSNKFSFYGKTGWAVRVKDNIGWFVGFVVTDNNVLFYVVNVKPTEKLNMDNFAASRIIASKMALRLFGLDF